MSLRYLHELQTSTNKMTHYKAFSSSVSRTKADLNLETVERRKNRRVQQTKKRRKTHELRQWKTFPCVCARVCVRVCARARVCV
jgi:hypothetical protein